MKIKNNAPRILTFGRILTLMPDAPAVEINPTQYEQLRRDRLIRHLIADETISVSPADLFDLDEDPDELEPVAMPSRKSGGFLDSKITSEAALKARRRVRENNDWSNADQGMRADDVEAVAADARRKAAVEAAKLTAPTTYTADNVDTLPEAEVLAFVAESKDVVLLGDMYKVTKNAKIKAALAERGNALTATKPAKK